MNQNERQGLWHRRDYRSGLQPSSHNADGFLGLRPRLVWRRAFGAYTFWPSLHLVFAIFALLASSLCAQQSTTTLRIRVLNARTNQPIPDERLNVALAADQIGSVALPTDKTGTIILDLTRPENRGRTTLRLLANMYADCRPRAELYTDYPIATILRTGITTGNLCGSAHPAPTPGQILLYEIPKTYIPNFPNGPNTTMPHSDERPPS